MEYKLLTCDELKTNLNSFCDLYRSCFNDYIDEEIVRKRYLGRQDSELLMCVAIENKKILANFAALPTQMVIGRMKIRAALALNLMTHPDHEGRGIFTYLEELLTEHMQKKGYSLIYSFPNYMSNGILCGKLGWKDIYEIPTLEFTVDDQKYEYDKSVISNDYDTCDYRSDGEERLLRVYKDRSYVKWRYQNHPSNEYFIISTADGSWCVYKFYRDIVNIVEFHAINTDDIKNMIFYVISMAQNNSMARVTIWMRTNTREHYFLEKTGFRNKYPVTYFAAKVLNLPEACPDIFDYRNWRIDMGDDNVY